MIDCLLQVLSGLTGLRQSVGFSMTFPAQCDQICFVIVPGATSKLSVVNLKV